jgi:hypothetical protein
MHYQHLCLREHLGQALGLDGNDAEGGAAVGLPGRLCNRSSGCRERIVLAADGEVGDAGEGAAGRDGEAGRDHGAQAGHGGC